MARRLRLLRYILAASMLIGANAACPKDGTKKDKLDPDTNSGQDAKRGGARPMFVNKGETDSVSWPKLQRTKWKKLEVQNPGVQNILDCELRIDNTGTDLDLDIFNSLGTQIGFSPGPAPNKLKKLPVQLDEVPGTYFVRMTAHGPKDESDFSVICHWEEQVIPPEPGPKPPKGPRPPRPPKPGPDPEPVTLEAKIEKGTEGRILQSFREGTKMVMFIDKGGAAGIRVGTEGTILEGRSGRAPLEGGSFRVVKVMDDGKCQVESNVRSIGRNNRIVLFLN